MLYHRREGSGVSQPRVMRDVLSAFILDGETFLQNQFFLHLWGGPQSDACSSESAKLKTKLAYFILFGDGAGQDSP